MTCPKSKGKRMLPWFIEWEKTAMYVIAEGSRVKQRMAERDS
jgi:hypothetical protein